MKKLFLLVVCVFFTHTTFGQSVSISDWDADNVYEYAKYSENNTLIESGKLLNGVYHGKLTVYYENGLVNVIAMFNQGKKDGTWTFYNEEGLKTHEVTYVDNKRVSTTHTRYFE